MPRRLGRPSVARRMVRTQPRRDQVGFFRPHRLPELLVDHKGVAMSREVWYHFRDIRQARRLGTRCGLKVEVLDLPFRPASRRSYVETVLKRIGEEHDTKIVLLDPDTGIERNSGASGHVKVREVEAF